MNFIQPNTRNRAYERVCLKPSPASFKLSMVSS